MSQKHYAYLVDTKDLSKQERGDLEKFLHSISFICKPQLRNNSFNEPPYYLVYTDYAPESFEKMPFPCKCSWENITGYDISQF